MNARPIDAPHDMLLPGTRPELEREAFCRSLTNYLETQARPRLRELYDRDVAPALRKSLGREPVRRDIADAMRERPADIFSRYDIGWTIAARESAELFFPDWT